MKNGEITSDIDPITELLSENAVFNPNNLTNVLSVFTGQVKNGEVWVEPSSTGKGLIIHIEKEAELSSSATSKYEIKITLEFHDIDMDLPTTAVTDYNTEVSNLNTEDWQNALLTASVILFAVANALDGVDEIAGVVAGITALLKGLAAAI